MNGNGHWKKLPAASFLVPTAEAVTAIQALAIQLPAAVTSTRPMPTSVLASALHFM